MSSTQSVQAATRGTIRPIDEMLVWDNHSCFPLRPDDHGFLPQLERYAKAGANVVMINVGFGTGSIEAHVRMIASLRDWCSRNSDRYRLIDTVEDIALARTMGQLAIGFDIEGTDALGEQLSMVRLYHDLGVRWMSIAYNRNGSAGGGCQEEDKGLSPFGRALLVEMASVGMVACCSHTGYRSAREVIDSSPTPVIFSHSNPRSLHDHPRNIPDDLIRACAARGGVIGINGIGIFLGDPSASTATLVRHVVHVAELVGTSHVGLGLDFVLDRRELDELVAGDTNLFPRHLGYSTGLQMLAPEQLPAILAALLAHGFHPTEAADVMGGNWMRIARQVWRSPPGIE